MLPVWGSNFPVETGKKPLEDVCFFRFFYVLTDQ